MEPLTSDEAVAMLLQKANISDHSERILADAEAIAALIERAPTLHVDRGHAFLHTDDRATSEARGYRRIYHTRQQDLLSYHPKLSSYDKSVLTAWELNFTPVERDSPAAARLLMLFYFLDAAITDNMLLRGCTGQNLWSACGENKQLTAISVSIDPYIVNLITDEVGYDDAVEKLLAFSLIRRNND